MAQFAQGFGFDLTDTFAGYVKLFADFFERVVGIHVDTKAHTQDFGFARGQAFEDFFGDFVQAGVHRGVCGGNVVGILDEVAQVRIVVVALWRFS